MQILENLRERMCTAVVSPVLVSQICLFIMQSLKIMKPTIVIRPITPPIKIYSISAGKTTKMQCNPCVRTEHKLGESELTFSPLHSACDWEPKENKMFDFTTCLLRAR